MKQLALLICALGLIFPAQAQESTNKAPLLFIYDASGSMWGEMEQSTKMQIASEVLSSTVNALAADQQIGLVAYGHRKKGDCRDVETLVSMQNTSKAEVSSAIKSIKPLGKTPLAYAASLVIDDLRKSKKKATIILITDGIESCDGNICQEIEKAKKEGIDFKLHIVGFGLKESETEQLKCAATSSGGNYYDASNASGLGDVLNEATQQTIEKDQDNFGVYAVKNGKPIDAWVQAYKAGTKDKFDVTRTYGDTTYLSLPTGKYDLEVRALSGSKVTPIFVRGVQSQDDQFNYEVISFDAGKIAVTSTNNSTGWDSALKVYDENGKTVATARTYGRLKEVEVNPGTYTLALNPLKISGKEVKFTSEKITVKANETTDFSHDFITGIANLGVQENGTLIDVTVSIYLRDRKTSIAGARSYTSASSNPRNFILSPNDYSVRLRGRKNGKDQIKWFDFTISQGETYSKMYDW